MNIEFLHVTAGDKEKEIDTSTPDGCKEAKEMIDSLLKKGTALFLERGKKTYRIKGYDPVKDKLICTVEKKGTAVAAPAKSDKGKVAAVPPIRGGSQ